MPQRMECTPLRLEDQCIYVYLNYLHDEMNLIFHLKNYQERSVLLRQHGLAPAKLIDKLQSQLSNSLTGILHDIVRQKMVNILISTLHNVPSCVQDFIGVSRPPPVLCKISDTFLINSGSTSLWPSSSSSSSHSQILHQGPTVAGGGGSNSPTHSGGSSSSGSLVRQGFNSVQQYRTFPRLQLFELIIHKDLRHLDFSQNKEWPENDQMQEMSRTLWKIIGEKCRRLEKLIVPKELTYSSTMNSVIMNGGRNLTHLTLKRNVPNNMFLSVIGHYCPSLRELDIAGADVITDFGVVCLLFDDPEQIFLECWHREKTVGSVRRSQRCFPHPHFDKPIPDPTEVAPTSGSSSNKNTTSFLHLRKTFHDVIRDNSFGWQTLPICYSLHKLRLENTKVKGDGASVVLECCPNLFSLGYLVFAAAGLKQVYGYEDSHDTKFTEIFYRGPSDQKLQTIANCCQKLRTMFLGSNSVRRLNAAVFAHWPQLEYLTLENIIVDDVAACLELVGKQLRGLKIQCSGFDMMDVAVNCPNLVSLIIQKECPFSNMSSRTRQDRIGSHKILFPRLQHLEITCPSFPKACFGLIVSHAPYLKSVKVFDMPGLRRENFEEWANHLQHLETLIVFRAPEINKEAIDVILDSFPSLQRLGDFHSFDLRRPHDMKRLHNRIRDEGWNLTLIDSPTTHSDEKDFNKLLSLHWFYLTESPASAK
jgi:hypothetical protein